MNSGSINKPNRNPVKYDLLVKNIPCRSRNGGNDCPITAGESIQNRRFPHIRFSKDHNPGTVTKHSSRPSVCNQFTNRMLRIGKLVRKSFHAILLHLFRIIDGSIQRSKRIQKTLFSGMNRSADASVKLVQCDLSAFLRICRNDIHNGLRLTQIHFPVQKRAPCKLAAFCRPKPTRGQKLKDSLHGPWPAVAVDLKHVLACIAVRTAEKDSHHIINDLIVRSDLRKEQSPRLIGNASFEKFFRVSGSRSGYPDYGNRAPDSC